MWWPTFGRTAPLLIKTVLRKSEKVSVKNIASWLQTRFRFHLSLFITFDPTSNISQTVWPSLRQIGKKLLVCRIGFYDLTLWSAFNRTRPIQTWSRYNSNHSEEVFVKNQNSTVYTRLRFQMTYWFFLPNNAYFKGFQDMIEINILIKFKRDWTKFNVLKV